MIIIIGAILFSTKAILVKLAYRHDIDHLSLLAIRMSIAFPIYTVILILRKKKKDEVRLRRKDIFHIALFGILGYYLASYFDFKGLQFISAGLERVILFLYPTIVLFLSAVFLKKKIFKVQILAILISYVGVSMAYLGDISWTDNPDIHRGVIYVFIAAITYASYLVGSGWLLPRVGTIRFTGIAMLCASGYVVIHYLIAGGTLESLLQHDHEVYIYGAAMAVIATVIPSFMVSEGIRRIGANNAAIIGGIGPVSTIIMGYYILGESFTLLQLAGTGLVIMGILIISLKGK